MLAVLAEVKLVAQFWRRPGNAPCANHLLAFTLDLLGNLPRHLRVRLIRADSGFHYDPWLCLLESQGLRYIGSPIRRPPLVPSASSVVADLSVRVKSLIKKHTQWHPTALAGTGSPVGQPPLFPSATSEVAEVEYESQSAARPRRLILIRRRADGDQRGGGKLLLDCPGYKYQALLTNLPASTGPLAVWLDYNGRAGIESVIKELRHGDGLPGLCCQSFFATEAALSLCVLAYNLTALFCRHLGWLERVTIGTLRDRLFGCAGIISRAQGVVTLKLGIPPPHRAWWQAIWAKLLSPLPNCNAVAQTP